MMEYRKVKWLAVALSVFSVPLGVYIGYMMALGNWFFLLGMVVLMLADYVASVAWLKTIEAASGKGKRIQSGVSKTA